MMKLAISERAKFSDEFRRADECAVAGEIRDGGGGGGGFTLLVVGGRATAAAAAAITTTITATFDATAPL